MQSAVMMTAASASCSLSSSPSSRISYESAMQDLKDVDLDVEIKSEELVDLGFRGLGQKVHPLTQEEMQKCEELKFPEHLILGFDKEEIDAKHKIEVLEQKVRGLMVDKGGNDVNLKKFGDEKESAEFRGLNEKEIEKTVLDSIVADGKICNRVEEMRKYEEFEALKLISDQAVEIENELARLRVSPGKLECMKKKFVTKLHRLRIMLDELDWRDGDAEYEMKEGNVSDELSSCDLDAEVEAGIMVVEMGEESKLRRLRNEIDLLDLMLSKVSTGLLDSGTLKGEVRALKGSEDVVKDMGVKMVDLNDRLWEMKSSIWELSGKKKKELIFWIEKQKQNLENEGKERAGSKLSWSVIATSVGAIAVAAAVAFMRHREEKANGERGNKCRTG